MSKCAFISHSTADGQIALDICNIIEKEGFSCWIAPRDIKAGQNWDVEILDGLETTAALILLFSSRVYNSKHVKRELEIAADCNNAILPIRIENVPLNKNYKYYLHGVQWTDAYEIPIKDKLKPLLYSLNKLCSTKQQRELGKIFIQYNSQNIFKKRTRYYAK